MDLIPIQSGDVAKKIESILPAMLKMPQVDCPVMHHYGPGVYIREVTLPEGSFAIGHYQKTTHMNIFLKGRVTMLNDDGSLSEIKAPMMFVSPPGRKVGHVHETVTWLNIYSTDETDVQKLEAKYLDKSDAFEDDYKKRFESAQRDVDISDFKHMTEEIGVSEETIWEESKNKDDQINMPYGHYKIKIDNSPIHGLGVFATADIEPGEFIAPALLSGLRTPVGRYSNHSPSANSKMVYCGKDIHLVAANSIKGCKGGQNGEEITTNYRETFWLKGGSTCQVS